MFDIKPLPKSVQISLRSGQNIKSYAACITQLVYNSLDAKATSIAIRINLITHKIQIIDNGNGITKSNLKLVGEPYMTNKYYSIKDEQKNKCCYGYRGETLFSLRQLCVKLSITSKTESKNGYTKHFKDGQPLEIEKTERSSVGTTVTVENFLYNHPVRQNYLENETVLLEIKNKLEKIVLIHPNTSFSLRNDGDGEILFQIPKTKYVVKTFEYLFGAEFSKNLRKIYYKSNNISVGGLLGIEASVQTKIQEIFVNKRVTKKNRLHKHVTSILTKALKDPYQDKEIFKKKYPIFVLSITCLTSEVEIIDYTESVIEFKNWDNILSCVKSAIEKILQQENLLPTEKSQLKNQKPLEYPKFDVTERPNVIRSKKIKRNPDDKKSKMNLRKLNIKKEKKHFFGTKIGSKKSVGGSLKRRKSKIKKSIEIKTHLESIFPERNFFPKEILNEEEKTNEVFNEILVGNEKISSVKILQKTDELQFKNKEKVPTQESNMGKHFLLDIFLKSTAVYDNKNDQMTINTIKSNLKSIIKPSTINSNKITQHRQNYVSENILPESKEKIFVNNKNNKCNENFKVPKNPTRVLKQSQKNFLQSKVLDQKSVSSSGVGKKIIMDAFLKSTLIYKKDYDMNSLFPTPKTQKFSIISKKSVSIFDKTLIRNKIGTISIQKYHNREPEHSFPDEQEKILAYAQKNHHYNLNENAQTYFSNKNIPHKISDNKNREINNIHENSPFSDEQGNILVYDCSKNRYAPEKISRNNFVQQNMGDPTKNFYKNNIIKVHAGHRPSFSHEQEKILSYVHKNYNHELKENSEHEKNGDRDTNFYKNNTFGYPTRYRPSYTLEGEQNLNYISHKNVQKVQNITGVPKKVPKIIQNNFGVTKNGPNITKNGFEKMGNPFKKGLLEHNLKKNSIDKQNDNFVPQSSDSINFEYRPVSNAYGKNFLDKNGPQISSGAQNNFYQKKSKFIGGRGYQRVFMPQRNKGPINFNFNPKIGRRDFFENIAFDRKRNKFFDFSPYVIRKNKFYLPTLESTFSHRSVILFKKKNHRCCSKLKKNLEKWIQKNFEINLNNKNFVKQKNYNKKIVRKTEKFYRGHHFVNTEQDGPQEIMRNTGNEYNFPNTWQSHPNRDFMCNNQNIPSNNKEKTYFSPRPIPVEQENELGLSDVSDLFFQPKFCSTLNITKNKQVLENKEQILNSSKTKTGSFHDGNLLTKVRNCNEGKNFDFEPHKNARVVKKGPTLATKNQIRHILAPQNKIGPRNDLKLNKKLSKRVFDENKKLDLDNQDYDRVPKNGEKSLKNQKDFLNRVNLDQIFFKNAAATNVQNFVFEPKMGPSETKALSPKVLKKINTTFSSLNTSNLLPKNGHQNCFQSQSIDKNQNFMNISENDPNPILNSTSNEITQKNIKRDQNLSEKKSKTRSCDPKNNFNDHFFILNQNSDAKVEKFNGNVINGPVFNFGLDPKFGLHGSFENTQGIPDDILTPINVSAISQDQTYLDMFPKESLTNLKKNFLGPNETKRFKMKNFLESNKGNNSESILVITLNNMTPQKDIIFEKNSVFDSSHSVKENGDTQLPKNTQISILKPENLESKAVNEKNDPKNLVESKKLGAVTKKRRIESKNWNLEKSNNVAIGLRGQYEENYTLGAEVKKLGAVTKKTFLEPQTLIFDSNYTQNVNEANVLNQPQSHMFSEPENHDSECIRAPETSKIYRNSINLYKSCSTFDVNNFLEVVYSNEETCKGTEQKEKSKNLLENKKNRFSLHVHNLELRQATKNTGNDNLDENIDTNDENLNNEMTNDDLNSKEWIEQKNMQGKEVLVNVRTGMSIFQKPTDNTFSITTRYVDMPKGMSPIMYATSKPSQELTPISKNVLYETMAKCGADDVKTVKWLKYFKDKDAVSFFNNLYENMNYYESDIPSLNKNATKLFEEYKFTKEIFKKLTIINQLDKKFIVATYNDENNRKILVLFDQHAVDERIRLEKLLKHYKESSDNSYKKIKCKNNFQIKLSNTELQMMRNSLVQKQFESWGIFYKKEQQNTVLITHIPLFLQSKDDSYKSNTDGSCIKQLVNYVIKEQDQFLKTAGKINSILPLSLLNIIKYESCRGAIKFGDELSLDKCIELIKKLSKCDLPFECAHGRPTLTIITNLIDVQVKEQNSKINLKKIKLYESL